MDGPYAMYLRRSTTEEDRQQYSLEAQKDACEKYANREGLWVPKNAIIEEKHSAKIAGKRPLFMQLLKDLEKNKYKGVIVHKVNRLLRNNGDFVKVEWLLDNTEAEFHFLDGMFPNNSHGRFMFAMMVAQSKWYIDNLSEEVIKGMDISRKKGFFPHIAPPGYTEIWKVQAGINPEDGRGRKVLDPKTAPIIREGMTLYSIGQISSIFNLTQWLNDKGVRTPEGQPLHIRSVEQILKNPFYYGVVKNGGELVAGAHPPLITKDLFDTIQLVMQNKSSFTNESISKIFTYRGLLRCICGRTLSPMRSKGHPYYGCTSPAGCGGTCNEQIIEDQIIALFQPILANLIPLEKVRHSMSELKKYSFQDKANKMVEFEARIKQLDDELAKCRGMVLQGIFTKDDFEAEKIRLDAEKLAIEQQKMDFDMTDPNAFEEFFIKLKHIRMALDSYKTLTQLEKHQIIKLMFLKLTFNGKILASYSLRPSFEMLAKPIEGTLVEHEGWVKTSIPSLLKQIVQDWSISEYDSLNESTLQA